MSTDESGVRTLLDQIYTAMKTNDADAYVEGYAEQVTVAMPGAYFRDRAALHEAIRGLFGGPLAGATGSYDVQSIRFLGSDVAVVVSLGTVLLAEQRAGEVEPWLDTWVLARSGGYWKVAAFHSCPQSL
jgi:uncharacterized protein (TIGR02246 family)